MFRLRTVTTPAVAALTAATLALALAPADAHRGGGGSGPGGAGAARSGFALTLTTDATAVLDAADVDLDALYGAWTRRDDEGAIVVSFAGGSRRSGTTGLRGGFVLTADDASSTEWSGFVVDRDAGVVTADVDGVEDVEVFTFDVTDTDTATDADARRSRGTAAPVELALTQDAATALDGVVGADAFDAGDAVATAAPCRR